MVDPTTQLIHLQVLYDEVLARTLNISKHTLNIPGKGHATFGDINGRPLALPPLIFPFRRALYWKSLNQYEEVMHSGRSHCCAEASFPDADGWASIKNACMLNSECGDSLLFQAACDLYQSVSESDEQDAKEHAI